MSEVQAPSLSQVVRQLLQTHNIPHNPSLSPLAELMAWGLDHQQSQQYPVLRQAQRDWVDHLLGWSAAQVDHFLQRPDPEDRTVADAVNPAELAHLSPARASRLLLGLLHSRLLTYDPDYPTHLQPRGLSEENP